LKKYNKSIVVSLLIGIAFGLTLAKVLEIKITLHPKFVWFLDRMSYQPLKRSHEDEGSLEICYFEEKSDLKKIQKSDCEKTLSRDRVSEGNFALKCLFPDGGSNISFYGTVPRNWKEYKYLKFDVFSVDNNIPLQLSISDTHNKSYHDRYSNPEIRLSSGWNHINIPVSDIDRKLIINDINHINIYLWKVDGEHTLYLDNMHLTKNEENKEEAAPNEVTAMEGDITITIDPSKEIGKVSRLLYGSNLSPKCESDHRIWNFVKDRGVTCFRFPGGGSPGWNWETGEADFQEKVKNMPLGKIDYLVKFCEKCEAELIMQVNLESGTAAEAAGLVKYLNKETGFRVDYWELGNEVPGDWDNAHTTPQNYSRIIETYSKAMKSVDPTIKIGTNWTSSDHNPANWDRTVMKLAGEYIDFISIHWYPNHINATHKYEGRIHPTAEEIMSNYLVIPDIIERAHEIIAKEAPGRKGKIEITFLEWDGSWDAPPSAPLPYTETAGIWSLANAIFYADALGQFAENNVTVSAQFNLQECMFGLIRGWDPGEGWGGQKWDTVTIRPKAFTIEMYSRHFGDIAVESEVKNSPFYVKKRDWWPVTYAGAVPYISCYASKFSRDNKLGLILTNKDNNESHQAHIDIKAEFDGRKKCDLWILTGPDLMAHNDSKPRNIELKELPAQEVESTFTYEIPPRSVVAMEIGL